MPYRLMNTNNEGALIDPFEKVVKIPMNFAVLLRGDIEQLKKVAAILEAQQYAKVVFTDVSADPIWFHKGRKEDEKDKG